MEPRLESLKKLFAELTPAVDFCSMRIVDERSEDISVRQNILQPLTSARSHGAMISVIHQGGYGYAATSDLSRSGIQQAIRRSSNWAKISAGKSVTDFSAIPQSAAQGTYQGPASKPWSRADMIGLLMQESATCHIDDRIVDWGAAATSIRTDQWFFSSNGTEILQQAGFYGAGIKIAQEAIDLLSAQNCPSGHMDLLLLPEQMMLQIHESIGHPLELDRILGDERNFAGTSFVTPEMFGHFQYGSALLNVTHDPQRAEEFASYRWDDDGTPAEKTWLIKDGILQRPLGSALSQARSGMAGLANSRACDWNRPPIDRMANLNIEPGESSLQQMIASVEHGVLMNTNVSWSIDDSRNKFQFGCEYGRLIENGELTGLIKNPNYRGISESFWRSLKMVGDASTYAVMGTPFCGKGEPSQVIRVGHASPACLFDQVEVFGGEL